MAVYEARKMTAKKAHTDTMNLLVVPLGFCTGTELLKTRPQSNHMAFPMVNDGPCGSRKPVRDEKSNTKEKSRKRKHDEELKMKDYETLNSHFYLTLCK